MPFCLEVRNLCKTYGEGRRSVEALKGLSFNVPGGNFLSVLGPSASGKTTLLLLLGGQMNATSGEVRFEGDAVTGMDASSLAEYRRTQVGFLTSDPGLVPTLSVLENVALPLRLAGAGRKTAFRKAEETLERVGALGTTAVGFQELTSLEMSLVSLARALVHEPKLLLADEPTARLDSASGMAHLRVLRDLSSRSRRTVVLAASDREAADLGDTVMALRDGRVTGTYPVGVARL